MRKSARALGVSIAEYLEDLEALTHVSIVDFSPEMEDITSNEAGSGRWWLLAAAAPALAAALALDVAVAVAVALALGGSRR